MQIDFAIVEDQPEEARRLAEEIERVAAERSTPFLAKCQVFLNGETFLASPLCREERTAVLMDICMDGIGGVETARRLRRENPVCPVIFLTSSAEYAWQVFPVHPFDYLLKPLKTEELERVIAELIRFLGGGDDIHLRLPRQTANLPRKQIESIVADGHYSRVRLTGGDMLRSLTPFSELEQLLKTDARFLLVNRGVLINMDETLKLEDGAVYMKDGSAFPLRQRSRGELAKDYLHYQFQRMQEGDKR